MLWLRCGTVVTLLRTALYVTRGSIETIILTLWDVSGDLTGAFNTSTDNSANKLWQHKWEECPVPGSSTDANPLNRAECVRCGTIWSGDIVRCDAPYEVVGQSLHWQCSERGSFLCTPHLFCRRGDQQRSTISVISLPANKIGVVSARRN